MKEEPKLFLHPNPSRALSVSVNMRIRIINAPYLVIQWALADWKVDHIAGRMGGMSQDITLGVRALNDREGSRTGRTKCQRNKLENLEKE